jgi:hypothetical protein
VNCLTVIGEIKAPGYGGANLGFGVHDWVFALGTRQEDEAGDLVFVAIVSWKKSRWERAVAFGTWRRRRYLSR